MEEFIRNQGLDTAWAIILVLFVYLIGETLFSILNKRITISSNRNRTYQRFLIGLFRVLLMILLTLVILRIVGISTSNIVTFASVLSLGVSLALQGFLSGIVNGVIIITSKPFIEGEYVSIGDVEGTVISITVISTRLKTYDGQLVIIPNTTVQSSVITNYSRHSIRRIVIEIPVSYNADLNSTKEIITNVATSHPKIVKNPKPECRLTAYGDSNLTYTLKAWSSTDDYWDSLFDLKEKIFIELKNNSIKIDYNQVDILIKNNDYNKKGL